MQINVETKFEVGQEVFLIKKDRKVIEIRKNVKYAMVKDTLYLKDIQ